MGRRFIKKTCACDDDAAPCGYPGHEVRDYALCVCGHLLRDHLPSPIHSDMAEAAHCRECECADYDEEEHALPWIPEGRSGTGTNAGAPRAVVLDYYIEPNAEMYSGTRRRKV